MPIKNFNLSAVKKYFTLMTLFVCIFTPLAASEIQEAEAFIQKLSNQIILTINSELTVNNKQQNLITIFQENASVVTISRAALGAKWRTLDNNNRTQFTKAFTNYLVKKYGKQFGEFSEAKLVLERSIDIGKRGVLVQTRLIMPATAPISVKWQVWKKGGTFKLLDIIIEDISMLTMEREEIKNRLAVHNGDIKSMILDLKNN